MEEKVIPKNEGDGGPSWHAHILEALEAIDFTAGSGIDPTTEPEWVVNVLKQLVQQTMPAVGLTAREFTPRRLGRLLGQQQATWEVAAKVLEESLTPAQIAEGEAILKKLEENANKPGVASLLSAIKFAMNLFIAAETFIDRFNAISVEAVKTAWEQPNHLERLAFFQGLAEGLSKPGLPARATDATPLYQRLLVHRAEIQQLKTVPELREFLRRCGLSEQLLGHPKRLEKICERIGLSFAKPGRPRTAEIPTT